MKYKLNTSEYQCLIEACRRYSRFHSGKSILEVWTGLGAKTGYLQAWNNGYMVPFSGPVKYCMSWWILTKKGAEIVRYWLQLGFDYKKIECGPLPPRIKLN